MRIDKLIVENYKGFNSPQSVELARGINIITGQNNAGKTALLEAISLRFSSKPHRNIKTVLTPQALVNANSEVNVDLQLSIDEVKEQVFKLNDFRVPEIQAFDSSSINESNIWDLYFDENVLVKAKIINGGLTSASFVITKNRTSGNDRMNRFQVDGTTKRISFQQIRGGADSANQIIAPILNRIYLFRAERFNISQSSNGPNPDLRNDAGNLPEVLNLLQSNPSRFNMFNEYVRLIFPQIYRVTPVSIDSNQVQLKVWMEDPKHERMDLAIPLSECGTGLGQVLAILYVVLNSDSPRIIIIDEPNSFLHPGASRKLVEILKVHSQHQFIVSTHSTSTLASANPKTIHLLRSREAESFIESIDVTDTNNQQVYLAEIGAKLSDVFGADSILWVEGKTEEICLPKIIERMKNISLMGTVIVSVVSTGDFFKKRNRELVLDIYKKLSSGSGLMPPALGFLFDSEQFSETEKHDVQRESKGLIHFISRRTFENYLLNPNAIQAIIQAEAPELEIKKQQVEDWLEANKWNSKYIPSKFSKSKNESEWYSHVDGANLLKGLFSELSDTKISFDKIRHSVALCDWIIENSFQDLSEIQNILTSLLKVK